MTFRLYQRIFALVLVFTVGLTPSTWALTGFEVVSGDVSLAQEGDVFNITSNSQNAIVQWQTFNVGQNQSVNYFLPDPTASILNRILGGPSSIAGSINSNGTVLLSNPAGINIGATANINTGSFIATTLSITNADYLNNNWNFFRQDENPAAIINEGLISTSPGGFIVLAGGAVQNYGNLLAPNGSVNLTVGDKIRITMSNNQQLELEVTDALLQKVENFQQAVLNNGNIEAHQIDLEAKLADALYTEVVNNEGVIRATHAFQDGSTIRLQGQTNEHNAIVTNSGTLDAHNDQGQGGSVHLLGDKVAVTLGVIDASGTQGGGEILIGGDQQGLNKDIYQAQRVWIGPEATIQSNGVNHGSGGRIIVFSKSNTEVFGQLIARGGELGGNGGFIETSGLEGFHLVSVPDVSAPVGQGGTWLIDPYNITIVAGAGNTNINGTTPFTSNNNSAQLGVDLVTAGLVNGDVTIATGAAGAENGDITLNTPLDFNGIGNSGRTLTLNAHGNIVLNQDITDSNTTTADRLNLVFNADFDNDGAGYFDNNATLRTYGGNLNITGRNNIDNNQAAVEFGTVYTSGGNITIIGEHTAPHGANPVQTYSGIYTGSSLSEMDSGGGDITMTGSSQTLMGIYLNGKVYSQGGKIMLNGTGGTVDIPGNSFERGVDIEGSAAKLVDSGGGNINIQGSGFHLAVGHFSGMPIYTHGGNLSIVSTGGSVNLSSEIQTAGGNLSVTVPSPHNFIANYNSGVGYSRAQLKMGGGLLTLNSNNILMQNIGAPGPIIDLSGAGRLIWQKPDQSAPALGAGQIFDTPELAQVVNGTLEVNSVNSGSDIHLSTVDLTGQNLNLVLNAGGSILDQDGAATNITTDRNVQLIAGNTIGTGADALEVAITGTLTAQASGEDASGVSMNLNGTIGALKFLHTVDPSLGDVASLKDYYSNTHVARKPFSGISLFNNTVQYKLFSRSTPEHSFILRNNDISQLRNQINPVEGRILSDTPLIPPTSPVDLRPLLPSIQSGVNDNHIPLTIRLENPFDGNLSLVPMTH